MTRPTVPPDPSYGNGFDRVRTLSAPEDSRTWFHQNNRVGAGRASGRRTFR
jgi:hypothetical protein